MRETLARQAAWMREMLKFTLEQVSAWGARLATWLIVGNAGALVIGFNAAVGGTTCSPIYLAPVLWSFAAGLILAFGAAAINYLNGMFASALISKSVILINTIELSQATIESIQAKGQPLEADNPLDASIENAGRENEKLQRRLRWIPLGTVLSIVVFLISAGLFARGVLLPVMGGGELISSCAGGATEGPSENLGSGFGFAAPE